jgi:hypothetical protein
MAQALKPVSQMPLADMVLELVEQLMQAAIKHSSLMVLAYAMHLTVGYKTEVFQVAAG